jgi:hypothetical protein
LIIERYNSIGFPLTIIQTEERWRYGSFKLKNMELKNRIVMPPMCQYAVEAKDGAPNDSGRKAEDSQKLVAPMDIAHDA